MKVSINTYWDQLVENILDYLKVGLGDFYVSSAHRWLIYAVAFLLTGLFTFISLWVYENSDPLLRIPLTFKGMYAWHTAINFALSLAILDHLTAWYFRTWGAYERRTVGKTWVILGVTYVAGFVSQRILVYRLVALYAPAVLWTYEMNPTMRPGILPSVIFMLPFWGVVGYVLIRIMISKQAQVQELFRVRIDTFLEERQRQFSQECPKRSTEETVNAFDEDALLPLPPGEDLPPIRISQIGHITSEDHYLRIYYQSNGGIKNALIRMALKDLNAQLPDHQFIQIHRSHIINLEQVAGVKRSGRNIRVGTKYGDYELPVSRYRFPKILPELEKYLHPA